jgi:hypothetical protein
MFHEILSVLLQTVTAGEALCWQGVESFHLRRLLYRKKSNEQFVVYIEICIIIFQGTPHVSVLFSAIIRFYIYNVFRKNAFFKVS